MNPPALTLEERVGNMLCHFYGRDFWKFDADTKLREDIGLDALDLVHLEILIEHTFTIPVTSTDIAACRTVSDIVSLVRSKIAL